MTQNASLLPRLISVFMRPWTVAISVAVAVLLFRFPFWIAGNFGEISFEQLLFHATADTTGTPWRLIRSGLRELLLKPIAIGAIAYLFAWALTRIQTNFRHLKIGFYSLGYASSLGLGFIGGQETWHLAGIDEYVQAPTSSAMQGQFDWMKQWYVKPAVAQPTERRAYNLIWLYVESLEVSRVKPDRHPVLTAMHTLRQVDHHNLPGTTWTIGGMVSSQCGVPLLPFGLYAANGFGDAPNFMPGAVCIGDLLNGMGYQTEFIGGADTSFAGKGAFLTRHGYAKVIGKEQISQMTGQALPKDWWGYTDDMVLKLSIDEIKRLKGTGRPFFFSALTADTHGPRGYLSEHCRKQGHGADIDNIFDCVLRQTETFVSQLKSAGVLEDTVLVISGDHPFMGPKNLKISLSRQSDEQQKRTVYFAVHRPDGRQLAVSHMNHMDMYPTVLSAMGFGVGDSAAGLGRDLYVTDSLSASHEYSEFKRALRVKSTAYAALWQ